MSDEPKTESSMTARAQPLADAASTVCNMAPGVALCCAVATAGAAMATIAGTGVTWALIIGIVLVAVWTPQPLFHSGMELSAKHILRIGIALLGTQVSAESLHLRGAKLIKQASIG